MIMKSGLFLRLCLVGMGIMLGSSVVNATEYECIGHSCTDEWCNANCNHVPPNCPASLCRAATSDEPVQTYYRVYPYEFRNSDPQEEDSICTSDCNHAPQAVTCGHECIPTGTPNPHPFYWSINPVATDKWCYDNCNHNTPYCPPDFCEAIPSPSTTPSPSSTPTSGDTSGPEEILPPPPVTPSPSVAPVLSPIAPTPPSPTPPTSEVIPPTPGSNGDPHFLTWKNEHFEFHGQCDMILVKDPDFATGLGLEVQIRTQLVRYWSYIRNAVVRIGDDILELSGSSVDGVDNKGSNYWINFEHHGELSTIGGSLFPVELKVKCAAKRSLIIDLNSLYPGQKIVLSSFNEFVRVQFINASADSFGNSVGLLGDYNTGKTLARDGVTELNDYWEFGQEWQVLPSDHMLFHSVAAPQFPEMCRLPEDPRGARRRLDESSITEEQAEVACASLKNAIDRKDCVYDILATQDIDMVGAY